MKNMNLIINTHWDREYRWSFSETQYRLVEAVDDLLDIMAKDEGFACFHTDSQVSMLDDYLEMRPERTEEVRDLVEKGRIMTGPWYTLPAEFLVNGESLVRNITMGHQLSRQLGHTMKAAYNIFSWGQVSQLPQIYRQFGMDTIIFYRGINQTELDTLEFRWKGADGKEALALTFGDYHRLNFWHFVYLPYILGKGRGITRDSLGNAFLTQMCGEALPEGNHWLNNQEPVRDFESAKAGLAELIETVIHKSSTDELLFLQGFDQENPDPIVTELVDRLNQQMDDGQIEITSLEKYIAKVKAKLEHGHAELPCREGEMLSVEHTGDPYGPLYNGVFSARMPVKLANAKAEYLLINGAEPAAAWGKLMGMEYPSLMLDKAWKELLKNQQHDGIGGCHVDRVTQAMMERYRMTEDIAQTIIKKTLRQITAAVDFTYLEEQEIGLVVYNTLPFERKGTIACMIDVPVTWDLRYSGKSRREISLEAFLPDGSSVPAQMLLIEDDTIYSYLKYGNVFAFDASRCLVLLELEHIPQSGYLSLRVRPKKGELRPIEFISKKTNTMENEALVVEIQNNGTLKVTDKESGVVMERLHYFEDISEKAGPLSHNPSYEQLRISSLGENASIALLYNGSLRATYRITWRWKLPKRIETELKIHVPHGSEWIDQGRLRRSGELEELVITTDVTLQRGAREVEFHTCVDNNIRDHRLRVMFETGRQEAMFCRADSPYDIVERAITVPDSSGWYEAAARTWPSHSFVSVTDGQEEATVYHRGIPEYEVTDDASRTIALTLLRCFGNAGNPTEAYEYQELAECQGRQEFDYWLALSPSQRKDAQLAQAAMNLIQPCYAMQTTAHGGHMPHAASFLEVESEDFQVTAVLEGDSANSILVRGYNAAAEVCQVSIGLPSGLKQASIRTLEGELVQELAVMEDHLVKFTAGTREIVTVWMAW